MSQRLLLGARLIVAVLAVVVFLATPIHAQGQPASAVEEVIRTFFHSVLAKFDYGAFDRMVTPTARFIEAGRIMNVAAFKEFMRQYDGRMTVVYTLADFRTRVVGDVAYMSWRNQGKVVQNGVERDAEWLESAVLVKVDGSWRIDQPQSASVPRR